MVRIKYGNNKLLNYSREYQRQKQREVRNAVIKTGRFIQSQAKALAPVDLGNLRDSIEMKILEGGFTVEINVGADYAIYVEYGTGIYATQGSRAKKIPWTYFNERLGHFVTTEGMHAQPFWFPALEQGEKYYHRQLSKIFN